MLVLWCMPMMRKHLDDLRLMTVMTAYDSQERVTGNRASFLGRKGNGTSCHAWSAGKDLIIADIAERSHEVHSSDGRKKVERSICAWNLPDSLDWTFGLNMIKRCEMVQRLNIWIWIVCNSESQAEANDVGFWTTLLKPCGHVVHQGLVKSCGNWLMQNHRPPEKEKNGNKERTQACKGDTGSEKQKAHETDSMNQQPYANTVDYVHTCEGWSESFTWVRPSWITGGTAHCVTQGVRKGNPFHWPFAQLLWFLCENHKNPNDTGVGAARTCLSELDGLGLGDMLLQRKPEAPMWNQKDF